MSSVFSMRIAPPIGEAAVGGWTGTFGWREQKGSIRVPPQSRMAICWLGMLGATGEISYDDISFKPVAVSPAALQPKQSAPKKR